NQESRARRQRVQHRPRLILPLSRAAATGLLRDGVVPLGIAGGFQSAADLVEDGGVVDGGRDLVGFAVGELLHGTTQNLARTRLRQPLDDERLLEGGDRTDPLADQGDGLLRDRLVRTVDARLEDEEAERQLALELV